MSELERIKQAMADGEHTDGDLAYAVEQWEATLIKLDDLREQQSELGEYARRLEDLTRRQQIRLGSEVRNAYKTGYFDAIAEWAPQMAGSEAMRQHMQIRLAEHVAYVSSGAGDATSSTAEHVGYLSWPSKCTPWCPACAIDGEG